MTDEHEHAMKVWREADRAGEDAYVEAVETGTTAVEALVTAIQAAAAVIAADRAGLVAEIERLREALASIEEYWNRDQNETAMADACWNAVNTADAALKDTRHEHG